MPKEYKPHLHLIHLTQKGFFSFDLEAQKNRRTSLLLLFFVLLLSISRSPRMSGRSKGGKRKRDEDEGQGGRDSSQPPPPLSYERWYQEKWGRYDYYSHKTDPKDLLPDYLRFNLALFENQDDEFKELEEKQAKKLKQITLISDVDRNYDLTEKLENGGKEAKEQFDRFIKGLKVALDNNLEVFHLLFWEAGTGDPIFKSGHEIRRSERLADYDIFAHLADLYESGEMKEPCKLKEIILESSRVSASSFIRFVTAAKPPLRCFRTEDAMIHGRNFEDVIKALKDSIPDPKQLYEFATNSCVGGNNPVGTLAEYFPSLEVLEIPNVFGKADLKEELKKFKHLQKSDTAVPELLLRVCFHLEKGLCSLFATTDRHDDGHNGEGFLHFDDCHNSMECMHGWQVGIGVTEDDINEFWQECGAVLDEEGYDMDPEEEYCPSCEEEEEGGEGINIKGDEF